MAATPQDHQSSEHSHDSHQHGELNDDALGFIERAQALFADQKTAMHELTEIYTAEGSSEHFETFLDDLTYEALSANEEFVKNAEGMKNASPKEQERIRIEQRRLFDLYRQAIVEEAGLPTEASLDEIETAKTKIKARIEAAFDTGDEKPVDILKALGIIESDSEGVERFVYPEGLFPKSVDNKWETYLETVRNHLRTERAVRMGTRDKSELGEADLVRREAHNAVSRNVDAILGFSEMPDSEWDFEKTRNMLAKMRDQKYPTVETAEKAVTERALLNAVIGYHAVKALTGRLSDMHR